MKKILLVGNPNDDFSLLKDNLDAEYNVRPCHRIECAAIKERLELIKANLILFYATADTELCLDVLGFIKDEYSHIPVFVIANSSQVWEFMASYTSPQFSYYEISAGPEPVIDSVHEQFREIKGQTRYGINTLTTKPEGQDPVIVVVDDNPVVLRTLHSMLSPQYKVVPLSSGQLALNFLSKNPADLILLDYEMPEMNGQEVFEQLQANPFTSDIPVIFLTHKNTSNTVISVLGMEPFAYLVKPPQEERLLKTISEALNPNG